MTLAEWLDRWPRATRRDHADGVVYVWTDDIAPLMGSEYLRGRAELFHLSDYAVSSSSCGGYYLVRR